MQSHRIEPSGESPLLPAPTPRIGSVQALGLSDVLRAELQPCQLDGIVDELDELRGPLVESFEVARRGWEELAPRNGRGPRGDASTAEAELESAAYRLRVHSAIRSALPSTTPTEPFAIVGPATMVSILIVGAARNVADTLAEFLRSSTGPNTAMHGKLRELAIAAHAWVETYIDCRSIEWYSFDRDFELPPEL
jgi:hypothetical protein